MAANQMLVEAEKQDLKSMIPIICYYNMYNAQYQNIGYSEILALNMEIPFS